MSTQKNRLRQQMQCKYGRFDTQCLSNPKGLRIIRDLTDKYISIQNGPKSNLPKSLNK